MAGTFTFSGKLLNLDNVTPLIGATVRVTTPDYPDTGANIVYTGGGQAITDTSGAFTMQLVSEPYIRYAVTCDQATFGTVIFWPSTAGSTLDLSDVVVAYNFGPDLTGPAIDGGTLP